MPNRGQFIGRLTTTSCDHILSTPGLSDATAILGGNLVKMLGITA